MLRRSPVLALAILAALGAAVSLGTLALLGVLLAVRNRRRGAGPLPAAPVAPA